MVLTVDLLGQLMTLHVIKEAEKTGDALIIAKCLHNRAAILGEAGRFEEAEDAHRRVTALLASWPELQAQSLLGHANALFLRRRHAEAEPLLLRAAALPLRQRAPFLLALLLSSLGQGQA